MADIGNSIQSAVVAIQHGGVVVYPTEGVFGLGCDFRNEQSVHRILNLKQRPVNKGLVLIASHIQQVMPLINPINQTDLARALKTWPGHFTWIFPASKLTPDWITGDFDTVAVRISNHPPVKLLCDSLGHAIVSTSANVSGHDTFTNCQELHNLWADKVDYYLDLPLGDHTGPSSIRNANSNKVIR